MNALKKMDKKFVPWSHRSGVGDRKIALFIVETLYVACIISTIQVFRLGAGFLTLVAWLCGVVLGEPSVYMYASHDTIPAGNPVLGILGSPFCTRIAANATIRDS